MLIDFSQFDEIVVNRMNDGDGSVAARMETNSAGRFIQCRILPGSSIGEHEQSSGNDINLVISGYGHALCDGVREDLAPGVCHICPKGGRHAIFNDGDDDLVLFTVVL